MKALTYHPLFDPYHCAFRIIGFLAYNKGKAFQEDTIRIIDFYQLFPSELKQILAPSHLVTRRNRLTKNSSSISYAELPSARQLFMDLSRIQSITLRYICAKSVIDRKQFLAGFLLLNDRAMNNVMDESINNYVSANGDLLAFLSALAQESLNGPKGLKARTGLMEFRYDVM